MQGPNMAASGVMGVGAVITDDVWDAATNSRNIIEKRSINIETRRSSTLEKRVILVQGPC